MSERDEMPPSLTPTDPGMPSPYALRVLDVARSLIGQREVGGQNQGPIVERVCRPFLSASRFQQLYPAGKLLWCAAAACYCWWQVCPNFRPPKYVSLSAETLWARHQALGWAWVRGADPARAPKPADFVFFAKGDRRANVLASKFEIVHVGLVERIDGDVLHTLEGNTSDGQGERTTGEFTEKSYYWAGPHAEVLVWGFSAVVPPGVSS